MSTLIWLFDLIANAGHIVVGLTAAAVLIIGLLCAVVWVITRNG